MLRKNKVEVKVTSSSGPYPDPLPEHLHITYYFELDDGTLFREEVDCHFRAAEPDQSAANVLAFRKTGLYGVYDPGSRVYYLPHRIKQVTWQAANVPS